LLLLASIAAPAEEQRFPATGLVLASNPARKLVTIACGEIPGYMAAMTMSFPIPNANDFTNAKAGSMIDFVVVINKEKVHIEEVRTHIYQGLEPDPAAARRLKLLARSVDRSAKPLDIGDSVPDFTLTGQDGARISLSQFRGKIAAVNFIYTRCALPNFCVRSSNNFGELQKRFKKELKKNLVLLTVTFDPVHDTPQAMAKYSRRWNADPEAWHFLTGSELEIRRVCDLFGEDYFPDEGLMNHSLHTAIIDREGRLIANLEGNEFSAVQLGDFVQTVLGSANSVEQSRGHAETN
jgi:protein SCO1/2